MFVAGATGRLGARVVRELLGQGFRVRAGVRNLDKADTFLAIAASYGLLSAEELGRLQVVECDLERPDTIAPAIGSAAKVRTAGCGGHGTADALHSTGIAAVQRVGLCNPVLPPVLPSWGVPPFVVMS